MLKYFLLSILMTFSTLSAQPTNDVQALQKQIDDLNTKLDQTEHQDLNRMVESQKDFIGDWSAYARDTEESRKTEEQADKIRKEINELEQRKRALMQKQSSTNK